MTDTLSSTAAERLQSFVRRVENLEEDKAAVSADIKEVFAEAKSEGFDVKILRKVIRLRKQGQTARQEEEALVALYEQAINGQGDLFRDAA